jgi:hypothetical protein
MFIAIVAVVTVLTLVAVVVGVVVIGLRTAKPNAVTAAAGPMTASTAATANRGTVVYSDDFHDSTSGWTTETLPSGTTFSYSPAGYVVVAKGTLNHFATSPYDTPVQQVAIAVTATQSSDAPSGAGYGVSCWRGTDTAELRYDFIVTTAGDWEVDRIDGGLTSAPQVLKSGTSSFSLGSTPLMIHGMCATLSDLRTTRLVLFLGTQEIADFTDTANAMPDAGWQSDLIVSSDTVRTSTVTATLFEVRDLAR